MILFITHENLYGGSVEVPFIANLIFEESAIGFLDPLREIAEEHESRDNRILKHCDIFDFYKFALITRWRSNRDLLQHVSIQLRSRDDSATILVDFDSCLQHFVDALLCESGSEWGSL